MIILVFMNVNERSIEQLKAPLFFKLDFFFFSLHCNEKKNLLLPSIFFAIRKCPNFFIFAVFQYVPNSLFPIFVNNLFRYFMGQRSYSYTNVKLRR